MLHITINHWKGIPYDEDSPRKDTCCVNAKEFYDNELEPMISDPAPYGSRKWTYAQRLFFNIPNPETTSAENMMKAQSQMRDLFRYFRPNYDLFIYIIKSVCSNHPLVEMASCPRTYKKRNCEYLFEMSGGSKQPLEYYLNCVNLLYVETEPLKKTKEESVSDLYSGPVVQQGGEQQKNMLEGEEQKTVVVDMEQDVLNTPYGTGTLQEVRGDGMAVVRLPYGMAYLRACTSMSSPPHRHGGSLGGDGNADDAKKEEEKQKKSASPPSPNWLKPGWGKSL